MWAVGKDIWASYITKNAISRPQHAMLIASDPMLLYTHLPCANTFVTLHVTASQTPRKIQNKNELLYIHLSLKAAGQLVLFLKDVPPGAHSLMLTAQ